MRKGVILVLFLALFLIIQAVILPLSSVVPATDNGSPFETFIAAADGAESDQSFTSFEETLSEDVLHYPDVFLNKTDHVGDDGEDDWADSKVKDSTYWQFFDEWEEEIYFIHPDSNLVVEGFDYVCYGFVSGGSGYLKVYDGSLWETVITLTTSAAWHNGTHWGNILSGNNVTFQGGSNAAINLASVDYFAIRWHYMTLTSATHFGESFADVSDWEVTVGNPLTTDGDEMSGHLPNDNTNDIYRTNSPSISNAEGYYIEFRWRNNASGALWKIYGYTEDDGGGSSALLCVGNQETGTTSKTAKFIVGSTFSAGLECIAIYAKAYGDFDVAIMWDYLRIFPSTEEGFCHDGSTTEGVTTIGDASVSSDGLTLSIIKGAGGSAAYIYVDTTVTRAKYDPDYYPFLEVEFLSACVGNSTSIYVNDGTSSHALKLDFVITQTTYRFNTRAATGNDIQRFLIYALTSGGRVEIEYIKAYSIANFTVTQGNVATSDVMYVESSSLVYDRSAGEYMTLEYDPALSVDTSTYNIGNITLADTNPSGSNDYGIYFYGETEPAWRFDLDRFGFNGGTLTGIIFATYNANTLSAITFIEDSTAPTISDFWTVPYTPTESDDLTLAIYETDVGTGTYSVIFNAVDYPAGFNDIDYSATESSTKNGLWSYTFSAADVPAGYYAFDVTASDGANSATDLEILRVTTVVLQIHGVVLITATETTAQLSGHCNKDANYVIYEDDVNVGSGSVTDGWFSISWTKDTTAGMTIGLGIKFTAGIYTEWINGSYSVASATVLYVTDTVYSASDSYNYLSGHLNLDAVTWTAFDNDTQKDTGALNAGSFSIHWVKVFARGLHEWGVSFTDGVTTRWVNGSYEAEGLVITDLIVMQNNESIIVGGFFYTSNLTLTWESYEAGVFVDSGTLELVSSGEYNSIYWEKNIPLLFQNFTLSITADGSTINLHSYSLILDTATYLTTVSGSSLVIYEGDMYLDESTTHEGVEAGDMAVVVMGLIVFIFLVVIVVAVVTWRDGRNKAEQIYRAQIASGGYQ